MDASSTMIFLSDKGSTNNSFNNLSHLQPKTVFFSSFFRKINECDIQKYILIIIKQDFFIYIFLSILSKKTYKDYVVGVPIREHVKYVRVCRYVMDQNQKWFLRIFLISADYYMIFGRVDIWMMMHS